MKGVMMFVLVLIAFASSKDACSDVDIETDDFGVTTKEGWVHPQNKWVGFTLEEEGPTFQFHCSIWTLNPNNPVLQSGSILSIALENGEIVELQLVNDLYPNIGAYNNSIWKFKFLLSRDDLELLSSSSPVALKVQIIDENMVVDFSNRNGRKLQNMATCFYNNL